MNDMRQITALGRAIEDQSFGIIDQEAGEHPFTPAEWQVVRRVIHATADFEFKTLLAFHSRAISAGVGALRSGCKLIVDVKMIQAGLNEERLHAHGSSVISRISDADVIALAKQRNSTRAGVAMQKSAALGELEGSIIAIGNAPTALLETARLVREQGVRPALIIGVPVGFVSAAESKTAVSELAVPWIVSRGRKGGSPIAVAIIHALLLLLAAEVQA